MPRRTNSGANPGASSEVQTPTVDIERLLSTLNPAQLEGELSDLPPYNFSTWKSG